MSKLEFLKRVVVFLQKILAKLRFLDGATIDVCLRAVMNRG